MPRLSIERKHDRISKRSKSSMEKRDTTKMKKRSAKGTESRNANSKERSIRALTAGNEQKSSLVSGNLYDRLFYTDGDLGVNLNTGQHMVDPEVWETIRQALPKGYTIPDPDFYHLIKTNIRLPRL